MGEAFGGIEAGVVLGEEVGRGVVDIEEDGVDLRGHFGKSLVEGGGEKIGVAEVATGVVVEGFSEGDEFAAMPCDDGFEIIDDLEVGDFGEFEGSAGGVSKAEATDYHGEGFVGEGFDCFFEAEAREFLFDNREEGGHEEGISENDFVDFLVIEGEDGAFAKDEVAEWGGLKIEFLEAGCQHGGSGRFFREKKRD